MVKALFAFVTALVAACGGGTTTVETDMNTPAAQGAQVATFAAG